MKYCCHLLCCAAFAFAQSSSTLYSTDINGHVIAQAQYVASDGDKAQLSQSINGRSVPLQSSDTRVLTDEPNHRVVETTVRKYDATGQLAATERTVTDETKTPAGSTIRASVFSTDVNGHMQETERRLIETQKQDSTTTADVTISRPGLSGSFDTAEKRQVVTTTQGNTVRETESIQRPSGNGSQFAEAARRVREETKSGDKTVSSTALYEPDFQGKLALALQNVATTTKTGSGTQVTELNTYAPSVYGIAIEGQGGPKLREQQTIERAEKNGVVTETTVVRRPTLADPNRLGDPSAISTLVCTGKCEGPLQNPDVGRN